MKIKKNALIFCAQTLLGAIVAVIGVKLPDWVRDYKIKAYEDFKNFVDDRKFIRLNGGLKSKRVGPAIVDIVYKENTFVQYDFSKWKKNGDCIGILLGDNTVDMEDYCIMPEIEVYIFKNGCIANRYKGEACYG